MASCSRTCSDEELKKALADLDDVISRNPIREEHKSIRKDGEEKDKKEKKKKVYKLMADDVKLQALLNFKSRPISVNNVLDELQEEYKEKFKDLRTLLEVSEVLQRHRDDDIRANQEKIRHELQTKGYITYEATDDEDEEEAETPVVPHGRARGGEGRRRPRPGVTMSAGGVVKKLN